ncbi:MAG TPA: 3-oxoacyl-ACP synthase [Candidatus Sulfomarinibacteraceae bacterium]|nr:3-oxoacyl-ACP synthase [Candidatus Sulfomarinibacteraceae bacterium]
MSPRSVDHEPPIGILSVGTYIPETFVTAAEIAERSGVPEDVVIHKMGIVRKPVAGPGDHTNAMGLWAAEDAVDRAGVNPEEIDLILCTTEEWKEYPLWTAGIKLAHDLGARRAWAIDVQMRCATTMAVLKMAKAMMLGDPELSTVLIAGGYRNGDWVDYTNSRARFLFGLAAGGGAVLLRRGHPRNRLLESEVVVDGSFSHDVIIPVGGTVEPVTAEAIAAGRHRLDCPDPEAMKRRLDAVSMENFLLVVDRALERSGLGRADIGYLNVLHLKPSAHRFILDELGLTEEQTTYLDEYGHIGQQDAPLSIRLGLESGRLRDGMVMVMVAAGVGYAWSASVVRWG